MPTHGRFVGDQQFLLSDLIARTWNGSIWLLEFCWLRTPLRSSAARLLLGKSRTNRVVVDVTRDIRHGPLLNDDRRSRGACERAGGRQDYPLIILRETH